MRGESASISARLFALTVALLTSIGLPRAFAAPNDATQTAAAHFDRGKALYSDGRYEEAIKAFAAANELAPHRAALFNIGRCHQNLGQMDQALEFFERALAQTKAPQDRAALARRIERLRARPIDVLVSTRPPGAEVTVGARVKPEPRTTPLVVKLTPGDHLLLLRHAGHQLTAKRVVVERGKTTTVNVELPRLPREATPPRTCPARRCKQQRLVPDGGLHFAVGLLGGAVVSSDRGGLAGPGLQLLLSHDRLLVGGHAMVLVEGEATLSSPVQNNGATYDHAAFRRIVLQAEGGWRFPYRFFYLYGTVGLGIFLDRSVVSNASDDFVKERYAFTWSVGGGIEAMATPWLSFGMSLRLGLAHVVDDAISRLDGDVAPTDDHVPYGQFWATATFHL